jgi:hypothetical protein
VDVAMGMITIQCPRTGKQVSTGVEVDKARFDRMREKRFTMTCWLCGQEHEWSKRWATFVENFGGESADTSDCRAQDRHASDIQRAAQPKSARKSRSDSSSFGFNVFRRTTH